MGEMVPAPGEPRLPVPIDRYPPSPREGRRLLLPAPYQRREETRISCQEASVGLYEIDETGKVSVQFPAHPASPGQIIDIWI